MTPGHGRGCRCCEQTSLYPCPVARDQQGRHPSGRGRRGHGLRLGGCWGPGRASGSARCHRKDSTTSGAFSGLAKSPATMTASPTRPAPGGRPPCEATRDDDGSSGVYEGAPWERPVQGDSYAIGRLMLHSDPLREGMVVVRAHESDAEHRADGLQRIRPAPRKRGEELGVEPCCWRIDALPAPYGHRPCGAGIVRSLAGMLGPAGSPCTGETQLLCFD